jgi:hypothetical protein
MPGQHIKKIYNILSNKTLYIFLAYEDAQSKKYK